MKRLKYLLLLITATFALGLFTACSGNGINYEAEGYTAVVTFRFDGAIMQLPNTDVNDYISYAYKPDTLIFNPLDREGTSMMKPDYDFEGWYRDEACTQPWNFSTDKLGNEKITLYSNWTRRIRYSYALCYVDDDGEHVAGTVSVNAGNKLPNLDFDRMARAGYTPHYDPDRRFYSDAELNTPWNPDFTHPGGDTDTEVKVYVKYIEGEWTYVSDWDSLRKAVTSDKNVYVTNDIDAENGTWNAVDSYNSVFEGNGYEISNVGYYVNDIFCRTYLFTNLGDKAELRNFSVKDIEYTLRDGLNLSMFRVSAIAYTSSATAKITNVEISGVFRLDSSITFKKESLTEENKTQISDGLNKAVYSEVQPFITNFGSDIELIDA